MGILDKLKKKKPEPERSDPKLEIDKLVQDKKYDDALALHEKYFDENNARDWYTKGDLLTRLGKKQESLECYRKATNLDDSFYMAWFRVGQRHFEFGDFKKSSESFDKTLELEKSAGKHEWSNVVAFYFMMSLYMQYLDSHEEKIRKQVSGQIGKMQKIIGTNDSEEKFLTFCSENFQNIVTKLTPKMESSPENSDHSDQTR